MHPMILMTQGTRSAFVMLKMGDSCHLHNVNLKESYKLHLQVNYWTGNQQNPLSLSLYLSIFVFMSLFSLLLIPLYLSLLLSFYCPLFLYLWVFSLLSFSLSFSLCDKTLLNNIWKFLVAVTLTDLSWPWPDLVFYYSYRTTRVWTGLGSMRSYRVWRSSRLYPCHPMTLDLKGATINI